MAADSDPSKRMGNAPAFKPLSRRLSKKQVIPDVNGLARGGCTKFAVNCDSVIAADTANVRLPGGVAPIGGALSRLVWTVGLQRASQFALAGRNITTQEAFPWEAVNKVVLQAEVVPEVSKYAAIIIPRHCYLYNGRGDSAAVEQAVEITLERKFAELQKGENLLKGLKAFTEKTLPKWVGRRL